MWKVGIMQLDPLTSFLRILGFFFFWSMMFPVTNRLISWWPLNRIFHVCVSSHLSVDAAALEAKSSGSLEHANLVSVHPGQRGMKPAGALPVHSFSLETHRRDRSSLYMENVIINYTGCDISAVSDKQLQRNLQSVDSKVMCNHLRIKISP